MLNGIIKDLKTSFPLHIIQINTTHKHVDYNSSREFKLSWLKGFRDHIKHPKTMSSDSEILYQRLSNN